MSQRNWTLHELANLAEALAHALRLLPDASLSELSKSARVSRRDHSNAHERDRKNEAPAKEPGLLPRTRDDLMALLSNMSRMELIRLSVRIGMPVPVTSKDSTNKIVNRMTRYFLENPEHSRLIARDFRLGSPELTRALNTLLNFGGKRGTSK